MVVHRKLYTTEAFEHITQLPENAERRLELVAGEIIEVVSNNYCSMIAMYLGAKLLFFADEQHIGRVTGADGGYVVGSERYIPDVALITYKRQSEASKLAYNPLAPDLAVEVEIEIHAPGQSVQILSADDTLTGGELLPGFSLSIADIFNR